MEIFIISHGMTSHKLLHPMFCFYSFTSTQLCLLVQLIIEQSQVFLLLTVTLPSWITIFIQKSRMLSSLICLPMHVRSRQEQVQLFLHDGDKCWRLQWEKQKVSLPGWLSFPSVHWQSFIFPHGHAYFGFFVSWRGPLCCTLVVSASRVLLTRGSPKRRQTRTATENVEKTIVRILTCECRSRDYECCIGLSAYIYIAGISLSVHQNNDINLYFTKFAKQIDVFQR